eukprot:gene23868-9433_t
MHATCSAQRRMTTSFHRNYNALPWATTPPLRPRNATSKFARPPQALADWNVVLQAAELGLQLLEPSPAPKAALIANTAELGLQLLEPSPGLKAGLIANTAVFTLGYKLLRKGLTPAGIAHAWFLGTTICSAFGLGGYFLVCLYFIFGTLVTKLKMKQKQAEGIAEARGGQRGPVGFVASFCSKLSDTVSSEVGKAYGKTTYLITTLAAVPRGTEGAVSLEGTAAGVGAAIAFTAVSLLVRQADYSTAPAIVAAAVLANTFESFLGATVQDSVDWLTNDRINMIQIVLAAALAIVLVAVLPHPAPPTTYPVVTIGFE